MRRSNRMFELIQMLRAAARPMTAADMAERLEVSVRTIYRDVAALQAMHTPIEGEPGIGYMMRRGYDLPPLNFDEEEVEALRVGLAMLSRTGDRALQRAADRICAKVDALNRPADWLQVSTWGAPLDDPQKGCVPKDMLRDAVRNERKLTLTYESLTGERTERTILPLALIYHVDCVLLAGWCELRGAFRHFRTDRIHAWQMLDETFVCQGMGLRALLRQQDWANPNGEARLQ
ncbi:MAG: YafY family protein [Minwuia sp.]|nr:YafY family protein [Minwuia sp.]